MLYVQWELANATLVRIREIGQIIKLLNWKGQRPKLICVQRLFRVIQVSDLSDSTVY